MNFMKYNPDSYVIKLVRQCDRWMYTENGLAVVITVIQNLYLKHFMQGHRGIIHLSILIKNNESIKPKSELER
jgi:hypothetical protein